MAANKALEVARRIGSSWVLGADTLVTLHEDQGVALSKPIDAADARRMLRLLSGRDHFVYTGIALVGPAGDGEPGVPATAVAKTRVWFRALTPEMIDDYVATGEPMDKAGAYGAQGF